LQIFHSNQQGQQLTIVQLTASSLFWCPSNFQSTWFSGEGGDFLGEKRPELAADHSPPSSTEVKYDGTIPLLPHMSPRHIA
jgi:hypothetical protein